MISRAGKLISFEGGEGGGKTLQTQALVKRLQAAGHEAVLLREPGGAVISEQIRDVVLSAKNTGMSYTSEVLLFQAARAQLYHEVVLPSLEKGKIVVMDRTRDSSVVYQGIVRKFGRDLIDQLNTISTQDTFPDKTLLLDVSVEIGLARRAKTGHIDRIDAENSKFHQQVRDAYLMLAQEDTTGRWVVIDAHQTVDEVEEAIWDVVAQVIAR